MTTVLEEKKYVTTTGKRKNAVASLMYNESLKEFTINDKKWTDYFNQTSYQLKVLSPFEVSKLPLLNMRFKVRGGGLNAQAEAVRHAISKLLKMLHPESEIISTLKKKGYLTRDSRKVERKKPGKEGARRTFQSQKR